MITLCTVLIYVCLRPRSSAANIVQNFLISIFKSVFVAIFFIVILPWSPQQRKPNYYELYITLSIVSTFFYGVLGGNAQLSAESFCLL